MQSANIDTDNNLILNLLIAFIIIVLIVLAYVLTRKNNSHYAKSFVSFFKNKKSRNKFLICVSVIFLAWLAFDLSGIGGNVRYYAKWIECGQKPVVSGGLWAGEVPHYVIPPTVSLVRLKVEQFCTEKEAELNGYSSSSYQYQFNHSTPQDRRDYKLTHDE